MSDKRPVSACLIVRNEESHLEACLRSIRDEVSEIVVLDTGSIDKTPEIAKKYADVFATTNECNDQDGRILSFSRARAASFQLATNLWRMWIDGDDEALHMNRLPELIEAAEDMGDFPTFIVLPYDYSHDQITGLVNCVHYRERIVKHWDCFSWVNPVHEVMIPKSGVSKLNRLNSEVIRIIHRRDGSKNVEKGRNLRILRQWYDANGDSDPRQTYYLGLEYGNEGHIQESIKYLTKYVDISNWDDEKCFACLKIAEHYGNQLNHSEQLLWALRALSICERWSESYFAVSKALFSLAMAAKNAGRNDMRNWEKVIHFIELGLSQPPTKTMLSVNPLERTAIMLRYLSISQIEIGSFASALENLKKAANASLGDDIIQKGVLDLEEQTTRITLALSVDKLVNIGRVSYATRQKIMDLLNPKGFTS